ncbi:COP23 domain-containing protein [Cylindrospermopsis raciborskii]|uniref:COP23 domain-containing protein n=1 Tax=Cylindrospermopsis raciborskii TaxID=77022 RepID=UPI00350F3765
MPFFLILEDPQFGQCTVDYLNSYLYYATPNNNQLFTLRSSSDSAQVLDRMGNILVGASSQPIVQSANNRKFLNMSSFLQQAPDMGLEK